MGALESVVGESDDIAGEELVAEAFEGVGVEVG